MAINMAEMEEDRKTAEELRILENKVNELISNTEGAHSYHKTVTRVSLDGKHALDYFDDSADVYLIYLPPDSSRLPRTISEVIERARKVRESTEPERRDFIRLLERRLEITEGITTGTEMVRRITFLGGHFVDIYASSRQVHVRIPSTRLPNPFREIIRLYQHEGYGIAGYAPAGGFI